MAHASPYLAAAVSNEPVYKTLILLALWNWDWDTDTPGNREYEKEVGSSPATDPARYMSASERKQILDQLFDHVRGFFPPLDLGREYVPLPRDERGALWSGIVRCRWCTSDRIVEQLRNRGRLIVIGWYVDYYGRWSSDKENESQ